MALVHEETVFNTATSAMISASGATVQGGTDQAYVVFLAMRGWQDVLSVTGGGLTWTERKEQCSGRGQVYNYCFTAQGSPASSFAVTASWGPSTVTTIVISTSRYSGANTTDAFEDETHGENTNGEDGACSGGTDDASPTFTLTSTANDSIHVVGLNSRGKTIDTEDGDYADRGSATAGSGGDEVNLYVRDNVLETAGDDTFDPTLNGNVDWSCVGAVIVPAPAAGGLTAGGLALLGVGK